MRSQGSRAHPVVWVAQLAVGVAALWLATRLTSYAASAHIAREPTAAQAVAPATSPHTANPHAPRELGPRWDSDAELPPPPPPVASYWLKAKLDETKHQVSGSGRIKWRNTSSVSVREIWLHLYLNTFKNDRTLFLRSPFGAGRSGDRAKDWGYIDVKKLTALEFASADLWKNAARHSPGDPQDETDIRVALPGEVLPGETLTLELEWESQLPRIIERTGFSQDYHFVAQWFPKVARLEPDGTWKHFAFHAQSEFYADFGSYDVTLDVPAHFVVGATGEQVEASESAGRKQLRHRVDQVHDFAWAAWPGFRALTERIDGVNVRLLYPRGHERNAQDTLGALRFGLPHFSGRYGRYPYPTLTVIHPPLHAANSGGMEYPTLITTGGQWHAGLASTAVPSVTLHELAHQWFYGLVATDEHSWPFLDEGLTSYAEQVALEERYPGSSLGSLLGFGVSRRAVSQSIAAEYAQDDVVGRPAAAFASFRSLGALVYARTAAILDTLAAVYGRAEMQRALGRYARYYRYKHPGPRHLVAAIREVMGDEAAQNLEKALFERGTVDYRVRSLESSRAQAARGVFDQEGDRRTVDSTAAAPESHVGRVLVYRHGDLKFPVQVRLVAEDGSERLEHWDGRSAWTELRYTGDSPLVYAVVDPDGRVGLDTEPLNNAVARSSASPARTRERLTYAAQTLLGVMSP